MRGRLGAMIFKESTVRASPKSTVPKNPAEKYRRTPTAELKIRPNAMQRPSTLEAVFPPLLPEDSAISLVTAMRMPAVESVMMRKYTEQMSWYRPTPSVPIRPDRNAIKKIPISRRIWEVSVKMTDRKSVV